MLTKLFPAVLLTLTVSVVHAQSFFLPTPEGWQEESFPIPIEFAPSINYEGEEHIRFAPGWGDTGSEELWSYCFLWWIKGDSKVSKESLERDLQAYYSGLVGRNIVSRKIEEAKIVPTVASFQKNEGDKSFKGTVSMLDYMNQRPIVLNIEVSQVVCEGDNKLAVFFAVSPQPATHKIWQQFKMVREGFRCVK